MQYIRLVGDDPSGAQSSSFTTEYGGVYPWYSDSGFGDDEEKGHGTHCAGSAAGATLYTPPRTAVCEGADRLGCLGVCLNDTYAQSLIDNDYIDWETWCEDYDCDGFDLDACPAQNISATLAENSGMAPGAKLAIFDVSHSGEYTWGSIAENGLWESTNGTGCRLHSNSWGGDSYCSVDSECIAYDEYMYNASEPVVVIKGKGVRGTEIGRREGMRVADSEATRHPRRVL